MSQVLTGARGVVTINSKIVGFVAGVNVSVENTLSDADIMGQLQVGDLAETAHKCTFTINTFRSVQATADKAGAVTVAENTAAAIGIDLGTDQGKTAAGDIVPGDVSKMRMQVPFDITLTDDITDATIFSLRGCKFEGGSGQVDARGIYQGTWNFKATTGFGI